MKEKVKVVGFIIGLIIVFYVIVYGMLLIMMLPPQAILPPFIWKIFGG